MFSKLEAFIEVAKTKNITKAADNLYTSQPSISMKIKSLEEEFGTQLLDRSKKTLELTEEGEVFLRYAESMVHLFHEATTVLNDFKDLNRGTLSISTGAYYGAYLLPNMLGKFKEKYPQIKIQVKVAFSETVIQDVLLNNHELGFISQTDQMEKYPNLVYEPYFKDKLLLICASEHPFAGLTQVDLEMVAQETFIKSDPSSVLRNLLDDLFRKEAVQFKQSIILNNVESIKRAVENNLGVSILPYLAVERELDLGILCTLPIKDISITRNLYYIYKNDKILSRAAKEFLQLSIQHFSNLSVQPPGISLDDELNDNRDASDN